MLTDEFGNTVEVDEPDPVNRGQTYTTTYQYDLLNHLVTASLPRGGNTQTRSWAYDGTTQRLNSQTQPETAMTSFTYNSYGLLATKVDANGNKKAFTYDTSQRVTAVRYYNSSGAEYTDKRVDYYWDTNPFDAAYSQNVTGRLAAKQYQPVSGTTVQEMFSYEKDGRLTKKRLRWKRGSTQQDLEASYAFDTPEGRPLTLTYPDGSMVTYSYNLLGQLSGLSQGSTVLASATYGPAGELLTFNDETREYNPLLQMTRMYTADRFTDLLYSYPATQNTGQVSSATVAGTGGTVYQSERYGNFSYDFAVPNGSYRVRLKFAEIFYTMADQRKFHVDLNGTRVLTSFDVWAAASGQNQSVDREFPVNVTGGHITMVFTSAVDNPTVSAIEIAGPSGFTPVRVNCGGSAYTDERGVVWSADTGYSGGWTYSTGSAVAGEKVNYSYDALGRLSTAAIDGSTGWGLSWSYDGWGNRLAQTATKGYAPPNVLTVDAATNRITSGGWLYDNNGNATQAGTGMPLTYDPENRLSTASGEQYGYAPDNKRVWRELASGTEQVTFWLGDRALARYTLSGATLVVDKVWRYFGSRNLSVLPDRVGSNVAGGRRYFPYGEEVAVSTGEDYRFGTYWRDSTGLDYADQRYYASWVGRFVTPDPYVGSAGVQHPGSWNRYSYVMGDPLNSNDPLGLGQCWIDYTGSQTGPPGGCNSMGLTAWSNGMDTWTSAPSSGLSQGYTINHVDQGAAREILYGRDQEAIFYGNLAQSDLAHLSNYQTLSGGALDSLTVSFQYGTFTVYYTNLYSTAYFPENSFWGRPPGTIWGPLTLPFAPDPQKPIIPKCPPGYHPT